MLRAGAADTLKQSLLAVILSEAKNLGQDIKST